MASKSAIQTAVKATAGRALRETGAALKNVAGQEIYSTLRSTMRLNGVKPFKTNDTFIAPSACVIGDVTNWDESSVWYGVVVRGDNASIEVGYKSNLQDRCVVNTVPALETKFPPICHIGHYVSIGSGSLLTSCRVEDFVIIGEKSIVGEGSMVESNVILEPGTVVPAYSRIPSGQRWGGNPAKFISNLDDGDKAHIQGNAEHVKDQAYEHMVEFLPYGSSYLHLEELRESGVDAIKG
uniref:Dynactin subunit 6 n=2 Tax=Proboscia inermis TaxID=420281 RepID=A0A7S0C2Q6_9STRA|mmetsp:Transcript_8489/g.9977  ORF Transcript_8489/g.9977 Transcript_8489/m.9977 type:complete len:238 (+) Transcript_8489:41-754(+)|eukprot:CAMPEP_0194377030 /NCGR_PEP_ID=MMETSP0174-20130528/29177_1 /TAXON_ID=216777 /ORGANISM="Proboscia alata, Strain PI-D3" /LENGTH=237 /DNA_ID=CAMNT_0039158097 /DNA_START=30 /DNA_END=743 /DNA_ORIENTATION=+